MRFLFLVDWTNKEVPAGGAEITDSHVIEAGRQLGHTIEVVRPKDLGTASLDRNDLVILSNCYEFEPSVISYVTSKLPYIVYSHDSGRWMRVVQKNKLLMEKSICNIFLSPLHRDCFKEYFSSESKNILVPPHIPISFYDKGLSRLNKIMFVGNIHEGKGILKVIDYAKNNPDTVLDFYYQRSSPHLLSQLKSLRNCNLVGYVNQEKIFENYNKYRYFIHIPSHDEAFGRAVAEALLCGCQLIANDKIGVLSYNWSYNELRERTLLGNYLFWYKLSDILGI